MEKMRLYFQFNYRLAWEVKAFEEVNQLKLNYEIGPRRPGDVEAIYANNSYAKKKLAWEAKHSLESMLSSAWKWQKALKNQ